MIYIDYESEVLTPVSNQISDVSKFHHQTSHVVFHFLCFLGSVEMLLNILSNLFMKCTDLSRPYDQIILTFLKHLSNVFFTSLNQNLLNFLTIHSKHGEEKIMRNLSAKIHICSHFLNDLINIWIFEACQG